MDVTESWSQKEELVATSTYQIYLNIKSMCEVAKLVEGLRGEHVLKSECVYMHVVLCKCLCREFMLMFCMYEDLQMMKYQSWFKKMVPVWFKVAIDKCKERIDKAVELDKVPKLI